MKRILTFITQVQEEAKKTSWIGKKDLTVLLAYTLIFVTISACFFFVIDIILFKIVNWLLGI